MDADKPMELVRMPREEQVFEREAIFGRDATSVFPSESRKARQQQMDDLKKAVGLDSSRFITESQLEDIKKTRGGTVEDGTVVRDKTLAAILAENKVKKEEAFQEVWKTMKQGKNRPLDEDDLAFVNGLVDSEQARDQSIRDAERNDLESFQQAMRRASERRQQAAEASSAPQDEKDSLKPNTRKLAQQPVIRVKQKDGGQKRTGLPNPDGEAIKRQRAEEEQPPDISDPSVLAGLMDGYASDSESDG